MKFFWKLFLSIFIISLSFFITGSYYLIHDSFSYSLDSETENAKEDHQKCMDALYGKINHAIRTSNPQTLEELSEQILTTPENRPDHDSKGLNTPFKLSNSDYGTLLENNWIEMGTQTDGVELVTVESRTYIHKVSTMTILESDFYLETYQDISSLITNRNHQYQSCLYLILFMLLIGGIVALLVSKLLTEPIKQLSSATKKISSGDFSAHVPIQSKDEFGQLSEDFNKMANQLEGTVEELRESVQRQETFVANFAHELKTPLTSIMGYADMLRSKKLSEEQIIIYSDYIFRESRRLENLSMKLLELSSLDKHTFDFRTISSEMLFDTVSMIVEPIFQDSKISFSMDVQPAMLTIDFDLIVTACINLIDNAKKSLSSEGDIRLTGYIDNQFFKISISDNGCGIAKEELSKITEAFYMVDKSRARKQGGAGLGLSLCSKIANLHHGGLDFQSTLGEGTCVTLSLPLS